MRIEAYSQIQQVYKPTHVNKTAAAAGVYRNDQVQISSIGKDMQIAKSAVASAPDIREDLVNSVKQKIQNGTYAVDTESFADKLLSKYAELR